MLLFLLSCTKDLALPPLPSLSYDAKHLVSSEKVIAPPKDAAIYDQAFIEELYFVFKKNPPTQLELDSWLNTLNQGASREGIYRSIVLDTTYLQKMEGDTPVSDEVKTFLGKLHPFLETTNRRYIFNIFWMAEDRIEKALDIFDAYTYDDSLKWYAHLSSMLATNYADILKLEVRINRDEKFHYNWAKNLPIQYVKSEIILKLGKIIFALNNIPST